MKKIILKLIVFSFLLTIWAVPPAHPFCLLLDNIQKELNANPFLKKQGIKLRVADATNGYITIEMYRGDLDLREYIMAGIDITSNIFEEMLLSKYPAKNVLRTVNILRKTIDFVTKMDGVKLVLLTAVVEAEELAKIEADKIEMAKIEAIIKAKDDALPFFSLKPFVVSLADKDSQRNLKVTMKFKLSNEGLLKEFDERRAQLRNVILTLLESKTAAEIATLGGKFLLRQDIIKRVNANLIAGKVTRIYWDEFVVQ